MSWKDVKYHVRIEFEWEAWETAVPTVGVCEYKVRDALPAPMQRLNPIISVTKVRRPLFTGNLPPVPDNGANISAWRYYD